MTQKFGICTCHNKHNPINSRGLCPEGARERRESSAASKGIITKSVKAKNEIKDGIDNTRGSCSQDSKSNQTYGKESPEKKTVDFKASKIKPRSEKNKEIVAQELLMFKQIWEERPHFCEVTGKPLKAFDVRLFSHVLTKGAYPKFRLYKKNIVLCLYEKHFEWEFKTRKTLELSWIECLEFALKTEYYKK